MKYIGKSMKTQETKTQSNTLSLFLKDLSKAGKNYLQILNQLPLTFSPKCLHSIQTKDILSNNVLLTHTSTDFTIKSRNLLVRNNLIGGGTILSQLNNYFKIWFTKKAFYSILNLWKFKKNPNETLNNLLMDQSTNSINDCLVICHS